MSKYTNFLHTEAYRRTFLTYQTIALLLVVTILGFVYRDMFNTAQENFVSESTKVYEDVDRRVGHVVDSIDQFYTQLYATPGLAEDFFRFFGATAEEYTARRLTQTREPPASILADFKNLVLNSDNTIRHIICYATENVVDLEFNNQGDIRHRIITTEEAEEICRSGCFYQMDIHRNPTYLGKISIVLDVTGFADKSMAEIPGRGICFVMPHRVVSRGQVQISQTQAAALMEQSGFTRRVGTVDGTCYCAAYTSQYLPFTVLYLVQSQVLLQSLFWNFVLLTFCFLLAFGAINVVLIRRFSQDTEYIDAILHSMGEAEKENFAPVSIAGHNPEYDAIVRGLNDLYAHLDNQIQQKYKLTISQQKTQMDMLSAQLNPHFLYNTLERIRMRALIDNAPDVAEATAGLGLLYRNIVKTEPVIPMKQELEITKQYLDLMTFLYGDQFMYYFDVDPVVEEMMTPKIWMQPIVENFFKYNFQQDDQIKVIVIEIKAIPDGYECRFFDNMGSMEPERMQQINQTLGTDNSKLQGIGLNNVLYRLRLFYGGNVRMTMEKNEPQGICIHIVYEKGGTEDVSSADRG